MLRQLPFALRVFFRILRRKHFIYADSRHHAFSGAALEIAEGLMELEKAFVSEVESVEVLLEAKEILSHGKK